VTVPSFMETYEKLRESQLATNPHDLRGYVDVFLEGLTDIG